MTCYGKPSALPLTVLKKSRLHGAIIANHEKVEMADPSWPPAHPANHFMGLDPRPATAIMGDCLDKTFQRCGVLRSKFATERRDTFIS